MSSVSMEGGEDESGGDDGDFRVVAKCLCRPRLWNFLAVGAGVLDPQRRRLDRIAQRGIDGRATGGATGKIGNDDAEGAGFAIHECNIAGHEGFLIATRLGAR